MNKKMIIISACATIAVFVLVIMAGLNRAVLFGTGKSDIIDCNSDEKIDVKYECILVLGAGVLSDGTPSNMLEDRLRGAISLYFKGVSDIIVLSGDNSGEDYDEVSAMAKYCLEHGVPEEAIVRDDIGFSTSESIYNVVTTLEYHKFMVVTQRYHIYRAIYMAQRMGAEADGFCTDYRVYSLQAKRDIREYLARCKDFLKVNICPQK